jgi:predicted SAM-dependent methyltransferase
MPRKFETIEVLSHEPPFPAELMQDLGLRGIHCGSARRVTPGWLNTDQLHFRALDESEVERGRISRLNGHLFYLEFDSRQPYPFEDASFEWAHAEHFLEHLDLEQATGWLAQVRRLLKPGGHLRVSTPDLRRYMEGYLDPGNGFFAEHRERISGMRAFRDGGVPERPGWMVNQIFYMWGHHWIFDFEEIRYAAEQAGFDPEGVSRASFNEGRVAEVAAMDIAGRNDESIYVELTA